jgi:hypothetical protein
MPVLRMPDGKQVRFPDEMSKDEIKGIIYKKFPELAPKPEKQLSAGETATDALIGAGSGIAKAAVDTAALPAEAADGVNWLAKKAGVEGYLPDSANVPFLGPMVAASRTGKKYLENNQGFAKHVNAYTGYKPKSTTGKYAKTTGEFSAGLLGGKGGMLTRAGKYVLAPGLASETAGQLTEGTPIEGAARAIGGLGGMATGAGLLNKAGEAAFRRGLPTRASFQKSGTDAYEAAKKANVIIRNSSIQKMKADLSQHLDDLGFLPGSEQKASAVLDDVYRQLEGTNSKVLAGRGAQTGFGQKPFTLSDFDKVGSRIAKKIKDLSPTDKGDRRVLWAAKHFIDDYATNLTTKDVMAGDIKGGLKALKDAKKYWSQKSKLELLDQMEETAEDTGKSLYTRGGVEHGTRREFLKFLRKDPNKRQRLNKQELQAFKKVSRGTTAANLARGVGKHLGGFGLLPGAAGGAYLGGMSIGGPLGALAGMGVTVGGSALGRLLAKRSTLRSANDARAIIGGANTKRGYKTKLGTLLTLNQLREQAGY